MTSKNCTKCKELRPLSEFSRRSNASNCFQSYCKPCAKIVRDVYSHTKQGLALNTYSHQIRNSKVRGHPLPDYTSEQLLYWLNRQINFDCLYLNWINSGYNKLKTPSCDRVDDYKSYTLDNLRLVTWQENHSKWCADAKNGTNNKLSKAVKKINLDGELIKTYHSAIQAKRETGISQGSISSCCRGERKKAGGFVWRYA